MLARGITIVAGDLGPSGPVHTANMHRFVDLLLFSFLGLLALLYQCQGYEE